MWLFQPSGGILDSYILAMHGFGVSLEPHMLSRLDVQ